MKNENKNKEKCTIQKIRDIGVVVCSIFIVISMLSGLLSGNKKDIPEIDLDSFSIENLTEEEILKISHASRGFFSHFAYKGEKTGVSGTGYRDYDRDNTKFSCRKITGINTVNATKAEDCVVEWSIDFNVLKGNAKAVIVMDETEIIKEFEAGEDIVFSYEIVGEHEFYVKILCEKARVEIEVDRTIKPIV